MSRNLRSELTLSVHLANLFEDRTFFGPPEMRFGHSTGVIGCCICLYNCCINAQLELSDDLKNKNEFIELVSGLELFATPVNKHRVVV